MKKVLIFLGACFISVPAQAATIDIAIAVDSSGSMAVDDRWARTIDFTKWLLSSFDAYESSSDNEYRFGIIQFGSITMSGVYADIKYNFTDDQTLSSVNSAVDNLVHTGGSTPTGQAVSQAINLFDAQSDSSFNKHLFIVTDGVPTNSTDPCALKPLSFGVSVVAVDLSVNATALDCLVDNPITDIVEITNFSQSNVDAINTELTAVPLPATVWLFGSGLIGLIGLVRRKTNA